MSKNKHGLSRHIPADIARAVRQRDGFGCVVCGLGFITYEHLEPEFHDAHSHDINGIFLLCGGCANKRTKGVLSVATIKRHAASPAAKRTGFAREYMDIDDTHPEVVAGAITGRRCKVFLRIDNEDVISIRGPEEPGAPYRLNARIRDRQSNIILEVVDNEWRSSSENWDVETIGRSLEIRSRPNKISMRLRVEPPRRVVFDKIDFYHMGCRVFVEQINDFIAVTRSGAVFRSGGWESDGANVLIDFTEDGGLGIGQGGSALCHSATFGGPGVLRRNGPCFCGAKKRYKHCHGSYR